jgi:ligand-binding sensor domain-containing protein
MKKHLPLILLISLLSINLFSQWENYSSSNIPQITSDHVRALVVDSDGMIWFGTADGLIRFDGEFWERLSLESEAAADNSINQLKYYPEESAIWLATDNGSSKANISEGFSIQENYTIDNSDIYDAMVYSVEVNADDIKIFGTAAGVSIFNNSIWNGIQGLAAIDSINLADNPVRAIESYGENTFVASDGKGIYLTSNEVDGISFVTNWVFPYNIPTSDNVKAAFVDADGNQWYGTDEGAVFHTGITAQGSWGDPITTSEGLPDNQVNAIMQDSYGQIWFGTENGLAVQKLDETWSVYSETDGLINNRVLDIAEDAEKNIWIATHGGISQFTPPWVTGVPQHISEYFEMNIHPNPASDGVWIKYKLPVAAPLTISIFDISGKERKIIKDEYGTTGIHEHFWNLRDQNSKKLDRGIYFIRFQSGELTSTKKLIVL